MLKKKIADSIKENEINIVLQGMDNSTISR